MFDDDPDDFDPPEPWSAEPCRDIENLESMNAELLTESNDLKAENQRLTAEIQRLNQMIRRLRERIDEQGPVDLDEVMR